VTLFERLLENVPHALQTLISILPILPLFKGGDSMEIVTDMLVVPVLLL
jgi:hypothetical protein